MTLLDKYISLIENLSNLDGVYAVIIFGSFAKGRISKKSDLDVCFFIDKNNLQLKEKLIINANDELDISIFSDLPLSIQFDILKNGKIFKINDEEKFKDIKMRTLRRYKDESWVFKMIYQRRYGVKV